MRWVLPLSRASGFEHFRDLRCWRRSPEGVSRRRSARPGAASSLACCCILSADGLCSCPMTNRFGFDLYPKEVRWAAAEGVSEDVIAAVLLLHERSVEEIIPQLSPPELEKVIELVGRSPRLYPRGILEALDQHKNSLASAPITQSVPPNAAAVVSHNAAEPACQPDIRNKPDADQMRQAHERRLAMLRAHTPQSARPAPRPHRRS
jgi:hypothetical protein